MVLALAGVPAHAQQWNFYSAGSQSFHVPFVAATSGENPNNRYVALSLPHEGELKRNNFVVDTGSLGLVATPQYFTPGKNDVELSGAGTASISYSSDGLGTKGKLYLTTVTIHGEGNQTATARVPVLHGTESISSKPNDFHQLGIGFDRPGVQVQNGFQLPNMNLFLGLSQIGGQAVTNMNPGYIMASKDFTVNGQTFKPGIMLGLTQQNTGGFAFAQLLPNTSVPSLPAGCSQPGMNCPLSWNAPQGIAQVTTPGNPARNFTNLPMLPDTGIGWMILSVPNAGLPTVTAKCGAQAAGASDVACLPQGSTVQIFLPGQAQASFTFTAPATGEGIQVAQGPDAGTQVNTGLSFYNNLDYLYDPIGGFVGYRANRPDVSSLIVPLLAMQGTLSVQNGFATTLPGVLMADTTLLQAGAGTFSGAISGTGGLTVGSGNVTLAGANSYSGGTIVNNGAALTIGSTGSITGNLTVNAGASFTNNGTVNTPGVWQLNQGTFANNSAFLGNLANVATATNTGTLTGSVINGAAGSFANNGTVTGNVVNMGVWSGSGSHVGSMANSGVISPGNSIGATAVAGNFSQSSTGTFLTEVAGAGLSDRINVGGAATLGGQVLVSALPGMSFAPSTTYTILSAAGGLSGTFAVGERALSLPAVDPELRRQQRLSQPGDRRLCHCRGDADAGRGGQRARCQRQQRHRRLRHGAGRHGLQHVQQHPGAGDLAGDLRQQLCGLLDLRWSRAPSSS